MYISLLTVDHWEGPQVRRSEIDAPTLADVEAAIGDLDGSSTDLVILFASEVAHLGVGGGERGKYIVQLTYDNERCYLLLGNGDEAQTTRLQVGGQEGEYPGNVIVDRGAAVAAAKTFAPSGTRDPEYSWIED